LLKLADGAHEGSVEREARVGRGRVAQFLPWADGSGREIGSWRRLPQMAVCSLGYLIIAWCLFVPLARKDGDKYQLDGDRFEPFMFRVPDLSENLLRALRSLVTAPFLNHDSLQLVYVTALVLLFAVIFEVREGPLTTALVFFGSTLAAAVIGGVLLHLIYPELWDTSVLETAWKRKWSGASPGCFGIMGGLAARARRPWPLLGLFGLWEVFIWTVNLRDYTSVFHFVALFTGYLAVRYLIPPQARVTGWE
jgi:hypothetical protein